MAMSGFREIIFFLLLLLSAPMLCFGDDSMVSKIKQDKRKACASLAENWQVESLRAVSKEELPVTITINAKYPAVAIPGYFFETPCKHCHGTLIFNGALMIMPPMYPNYLSFKVFPDGSDRKRILKEFVWPLYQLIDYSTIKKNNSLDVYMVPYGDDIYFSVMDLPPKELDYTQLPVDWFHSMCSSVDGNEFCKGWLNYSDELFVGYINVSGVNYPVWDSVMKYTKELVGVWEDNCFIDE